MEGVPVSCTPHGPVPLPAPSSSNTVVAKVLGLRALLNTQVQTLYAYLGALFALRDVGGTLGETLQWQPSPLVVTELDAEIALALSSLVSVLGTRGESDAKAKHFPSAQAAFNKCATALELLAAHVSRTCNPNWPDALRQAPLEDSLARAVLMRLIACQCQLATEPDNWLPLCLGLIREYAHQAEMPGRSKWATTFARGHAYYWLMLCAERVYLERSSHIKGAPNLVSLVEREQLLALSLASAKETARVLESQPQLTSQCKRIGDWAQGLFPKVRAERFKWAVLRDEKTPKTEPVATVDFSLHLDVFHTPSSLVLPPPESPTDSALWSLISTEALNFTVMFGGPEALKNQWSSQSTPTPEPSLGVPFSFEILLGPLVSLRPFLSVRDQALVMVGTFVERSRWMHADPLSSPFELDEVQQVLEQAKHLILMDRQ